jgi:hypothetical protein
MSLATDPFSRVYPGGGPWVSGPLPTPTRTPSIVPTPGAGTEVHGESKRLKALRLAHELATAAFEAAEENLDALIADLQESLRTASSHIGAPRP